MSTMHALEIADAAFAIVKTIPGWNSTRRTPMVQVNPEDLPALGVYILREQWSADGDANAGEPSFVHDLSLGFSGAIALTDAVTQLTVLDGLMAAICSALLTNPNFIALSEGIASIDRRLVFSKEAETSLAEIQIEMRVQYRSNWPPLTPDDFNTLHVKTGFPAGGTQAERDAVQQAEAEYDIPQT